MSRKLNIPPVASLDLEGVKPGLVMFLLAVQDALERLDNNVVYKDQLDIFVQQPRIRELSARGQSFSVSNTVVASGDEYASHVAEVRAMLVDNLDLRAAFSSLIDQITQG
jgi:hypothetical protein